MSDATIKARRKRNVFLALQLFLMLGTALTLMILTMCRMESGEEGFTERFGTLITSLCITLGLLGFCLIVIGHKARSTIWMLCLLLATYLYSTEGMWTVFGVWGVDEYIIYPLYRAAKSSVQTNKIIDKRSGGV